jgi:hypothetical protein
LETFVKLHWDGKKFHHNLWDLSVGVKAGKVTDSLPITNMPIDTEKTTSIIDIIKSFTSSQIAVILFLIIGSVWSILFIENRYAKIVEIEQRFQQSQQQISQAHFLSLELLSLLSTEQQQTIRHKLELSRENKNNSRD